MQVPIVCCDCCILWYEYTPASCVCIYVFLCLYNQSSVRIFQLCGCGQGCGSAMSLFPLLSLAGASHTQQQSKARLCTLSLFFSWFVCFILAGGDKYFFVPSSVRLLHQTLNMPRSMTWFSTATSKKPVTSYKMYLILVPTRLMHQFSFLVKNIFRDFRFIFVTMFQ